MRVEKSKMERFRCFLISATVYVLGIGTGLLIVLAVNIAHNWGALTVAMQHPEIVSSLKVASPTFDIKK